MPLKMGSAQCQGETLPESVRVYGWDCSGVAQYSKNTQKTTKQEVISW